MGLESAPVETVKRVLEIPEIIGAVGRFSDI
jgi:hypothetical protein